MDVFLDNNFAYPPFHQEKGKTEEEVVSLTDLMDINLSKLREIVKDRGPSHAKVHGVTKSGT